jgi:VWFA-related protein
MDCRARFAVAVATVFLAWGALAEPAETQRRSRAVEDVVDVVVVEVPVTVVGRDGEPVRGLTKESFEVLEGRRRQPIVGFEVVDLAEVGAPGGRGVHEVTPAARRHFLLLFDHIFADLRALQRARRAALDFVAHQIHPTDLVAVAVYGTAGPRLILGFTSDRSQLELAVETLGAPQLVSRTPDPLALVLGERRAESVAGAEVGPGRDMAEGIEALVEEHQRDLAMADERFQRLQQENHVVALARSMKDLARVMGSVDGRKYLVYISEGFDSSLLVGEELEAEDRAAIESGEGWRVNPDAMYGSSRLQRDVEGMLEEFRRADFAIHAVDPSGLEAGGEVRSRVGGREASLLQMARDTGGALYTNFNDLGEAMERLAHRTSVTYLLTVQPEGLRHDGRFRRLDVRLVDGPAGARVHHRMGYYAPDPRAEEQPLARRLEVAGRILGGTPGGGLGTSVLAAPFPMAGEKAYVPVLLEIDGQTLLQGARREVVNTEIFAYALDHGGAVAGFFHKTLGVEVSKAGSALSQTGLKYWGHLELPPGSYAVRVLVRDAATGRSGLAVTQVTVPGFGGEEVALLPPLFPEPMGKWVLVAEAERPPVDYPFMDGEAPYVPAARPVVPARGETPLHLAFYGGGGEPPTITAKVRDAAGREASGASLHLGEAVARDGALQRFRATLRSEGLSPGDYVLDLFLGDGSGAGQSGSSIALRVDG